MKEPDYPITSWVGYTRKLREELGELTKAQIEKAMQGYIKGVKIEKMTEELK